MFYTSTKKYSALGLAALLMVTSPALASTSENAMVEPQKQHVVFDQNSDGMITLSELSKGFLGNISDETFSSYDLDESGALNASEFKTFLKRNQNAIERNYQAMIDAKIANQKNAAKAAQMQAEMERNSAENPAKIYLTMDFVVYDRNDDDMIDLEEFEHRTKSTESEMFFSKYDQNSDGKLSIKEFNSLVKSDDMMESKHRIKG